MTELKPLMDANLRDLVGSLVQDRSTVMIQRHGDQVLLSDRYVLWDLALLGETDEEFHVSANLATLPKDGTYAWKIDTDPIRAYADMSEALAERWKDLQAVHDAGLDWQSIRWTDWAHNGRRIGALGQNAVTVNCAWLDQVDEAFPYYQIVGRHPRKPLVILDDHDTPRVVGFVSPKQAPDGHSALSVILADLLSHPHR